MQNYLTSGTAEDRKKAKIITIISGVAIIALLFLTAFSIPFPPPEEEGIIVNLGNTNVGSGDVQPQNKSKVKEAPSQPAQPKPASQPKTQPVKAKEKVLTQDKEETTRITKTNTKKPTTKPVDKPTPTKEVVKPSPKVEETKEVAKETPKPTVNKKALYPGSRDVPSSGEGVTGDRGDQGAPNGDPNAKNHDGDRSYGTGGSGVGYSLSGRKMIKSPTVSDNSNATGKITVQIKVDQNGTVTDAKIGRPTTISAASLINKAIRAAYNAKFDANRDAAEEQWGTLTFVFKVR